MKYKMALAVAMLLFACNAFAQHEPTTTWPYLYGDFTKGEIKSMKDEAKPGIFNIHILYGRLHFIEGELIRELSPSEVVSVKIGSDYFVNVGGEMMKVLAMEGNVYVTEKQEVDMIRLNATGGAYGSSSSTLATTALSSLENIGNGMTATNHMELKNTKDDGKVLPMLSKMYIVVPGNVIYATKKDVLEMSGVDTKELNAFIKENKIKWKNPQSLLMLALYINEKSAR
jgi:hypothetical protein